MSPLTNNATLQYSYWSFYEVSDSFDGVYFSISPWNNFHTNLSLKEFDTLWHQHWFWSPLTHMFMQLGCIV